MASNKPHTGLLLKEAGHYMTKFNHGQDFWGVQIGGER